MKKLYKLSSQIILGILCSIFTLIFLISTIITAIFASDFNLFDGKKAFKEGVYEAAGNAYGIWVLSDVDSGINKDNHPDWNCNYGIILDYNKDEDNLNSDSTYVFKNFTNTPVPNDAYINTYTISKDNRFRLNEKLFSLWTNDYAFESSYHDDYHTYDIEGIGYDLIGQTLYVYANNQFYPIQQGFYDYSSEGVEPTPNTNAIYEKIWENRALEHEKQIAKAGDSDETTYVVADESAEEESTEKKSTEDSTTKDSAEKKSTEDSADSEETKDYLPTEEVTNNEGATDGRVLYIAGKPYAPLSDYVSGFTLDLWGDDGSEGVLSTDNIADLSSIHNELPSKEVYISFASITEIGIYSNDTSLKDYTFICFPKETRTGANDFYAQADALAAKGTLLQIFLPILCILSFLLALASFILFMLAAGHRNSEETIVARGTDRIYTDVALVITFFAYVAVAGLAATFCSGLPTSRASFFTILPICYVIAATMGLLLLSNFTVNFKLRRFFMHSVCGIVLTWLWGKFLEIHNRMKEICKTVPWTRRIWAIFFLFVVLEFLGICALSCEELLIAWFLEKVFFTVVLYVVLSGYAKIKDTTLKLASGDTDAQVDTSRLPLFLEEHGQALNDVQSGIVIALDERTRSERMKTELITNVSHDIKTPLTSIINYVDLLSKEDIESKNAKEYLEVLDRQSKRLKKLIEDLIEASKASTGNIKFNIEKINAQVLLNQSIGEFSERLEASQVGLVTNLPEQDLYLKADNRYLWRVFDNLMSNIVKYAQPGTRSYIDLTEDENKLRFVFRNTSKEELNISAEELMERFVRGDKSRYTDGNGLGLSIARSLTESMGGAMKVSIDGDLFKVTLEFNKI